MQEKIGTRTCEITSFRLARVEVPDSCTDFKGRATTGFRPKLHSRTESLSMENLDMSRAVGCESLDMATRVLETLFR